MNETTKYKEHHTPETDNSIQIKQGMRMLEHTTYPVCLPSNYSPWDLYKKSGLTTPTNNPRLGIGSKTQK